LVIAKGELVISERDKFYARMQEKWSVTDIEIKAILTEAKFDKFEIAKLNDYEKAIKKFVETRESKSRVLDIKKRYTPRHCIVPDCEGYEIEQGDGTWKCSIGGVRHFTAYRTALHWGLKKYSIIPEDELKDLIVLALQRLEEVDNQKKKEEEEQHAKETKGSEEQT